MHHRVSFTVVLIVGGGFKGGGRRPIGSYF